MSANLELLFALWLIVSATALLWIAYELTMIKIIMEVKK